MLSGICFKNNWSNKTEEKEDEGTMGPSLRKSGQWFNPGGRNTEAPLFHTTLGAEDNQRKTVFCYVTSLPISPCHWDILNIYGWSLSWEPCPLCSSPTGWRSVEGKGEAETGEDSVSSPVALSLQATFGLHFLIPSPSIPHLPKMEGRPLESPSESLLALYFCPSLPY